MSKTNKYKEIYKQIESVVNGETIIVPDVHKFPGHIACSSLSQSEIVVPMFCDGQVYAVLDIDSKELATFDEVDKEWLEKIVVLQLKK